MGNSLDKFFEEVQVIMDKKQDFLEMLVSDYSEKYIQERIDKLEYVTLKLKTALVYAEKKKPLKDELETYTIKEVASLLKTSRQTVKSYIDNGMLKALPINKDGKRGIIRIQKSDFQLFLDRKEEPPKYKRYS